MLETMVVLVVVGVLSTMSIGKLHKILVQQRVTRAANSLRSDIEGAFTIANRNRAPVRITWNSTKMQLQVTNRAGTTYFRRTPFGKEAYGLSASNVTFSSSPVEVYPNGFANSALTITVTLEGNTKTVSVSRAGLVRVQ